MYLSKKALEEFHRRMDGSVITKVGATKKFYHLSPTAGIKALEPRTSKMSERTHKRTRSRVSMGDSIHGCAQALFLPGYDRNYVYSPDDNMIHINDARISKYVFRFHVYEIDAEILKPNLIASYELDEDSKLIFDQTLTGEVGYYGKVPCTHIGTVDVRMLSEAEHLQSQPFPYIFYWVSPVSTKVGPTHYQDFEIKISSRDGSSSLDENLLEQHKNITQERWNLMRIETKKTFTQVYNKLMHYYDSGKITF